MESYEDLVKESYEDLDARNGMNRSPRSSRDLTAKSFEKQLMGYLHFTLKKFITRSYKTLC
jgi:hypothetical protein